jgi:hypothetical protein
MPCIPSSHNMYIERLLLREPLPVVREEQIVASGHKRTHGTSHMSLEELVEVARGGVAPQIHCPDSFCHANPRRDMH